MYDGVNKALVRSQDKPLERRHMKIESTNEYIARNIPSAKDVHKHYSKYGIFLDSRDQLLLDKVKKAYYLKEKGLNYQDILVGLTPLTLRVDSWVNCDYEFFGIGQVVEVFNSGNMFIKFKERRLPTMCDSKSTIHDEKKRKIRIIA